MKSQSLYVGEAAYSLPDQKIEGCYTEMLGEQYYCIRNYDRMEPFFMSIVSSSDHWLFISSSGGISAGRSNAENALFPYYPDDRISENSANTGHVAVLRVTRSARTFLWEPFSARYAGLYAVQRNLYKNSYGDKLIFEETNSDLGLTYRYTWRSTDSYGFVKTSWLITLSDQACQVTLLDGLQNLLPAGATTALQSNFSNLLNAYKRNELHVETGLGMSSLSSTLSDQAEPSEALRTTLAWQLGLEEARYLLSAQQLDAFRGGQEIEQETDIRGRRGAYLINAGFELAPAQEKEWSVIADVNQDGRSVAALLKRLEQDPAALALDVQRDIVEGTANLERIVASADGLQLSEDHTISVHHFSNVLFNTMRGGIFARNYSVGKNDLLNFVAHRNRLVLSRQAKFFAALPVEMESDDLLLRAAATGSGDLERLCYEYLPLTFGRRHGDPSRPWNQFSINLKQPDGSPRLDYQGNWRDIFQNWEPLAWSYPEFSEQMIAKFLNATTADGYNPYRITRDGIEWETPDPDNPWANIGYWSDHQIIYLQKLLEASHRFHPGRLQTLLTRKIFSNTNLPYRIKKHAAILEDWYNTISFDRQLDHAVAEKVAELGTDGRLLHTFEGQIFHVNMAEKMLILLLAKLGNLIPEGGIWMNTQRPEWNDANNALVGKGLSVVTAGYLRRYIVFYRALLADADVTSFSMTREVLDFLVSTQVVLEQHRTSLSGSFNDRERRAVMDQLGQASSDYRWNYYDNGLSGEFSGLKKNALLAFLDLAQAYIDHALKANERPANLFHAHNILQITDDMATVGHLYEMLEGQVAILSSGLLTSDQALALLHSLRNSNMYRADQHSYMLYPDRELPGFLKKNHIEAVQFKGLALVEKLVEQNDHSLVSRDINGVYHFNGTFRNDKDVRKALDTLKQQPALTKLVEAESGKILELFETAFEHKSFTGRSGTFFAYEGLGSIYWHMVTKLLLATQEAFFHALELGAPQSTCHALEEAHYDIRKRLGFNKSTDGHVAFPTHPYSHTPAGQGAKQPGMTGQVKEEILARFSELGLRVEQGLISFNPVLLSDHELSTQPGSFDYIGLDGKKQGLPMPAGALAYTFCQVPVVYMPAAEEKIELHFADGGKQSLAGHTLDAELSEHIFRRDGHIRQVTFFGAHQAAA